MTRAKLAVTAAAGLGTLIALFILAALVYGELSTAVSADPPFVLEVRQGEPFGHVVRRLAAEGRLVRPGLLRTLAVLRGDAGRVKSGDYALSGRVSPNELLRMLVAGQANFAAITIPEGFSLHEIARRVGEQGLGQAREFLRLAHDPAFIARLNLPFSPNGNTLEGFIFPDTYYIHRAAGEAALLTSMVREFKKRVAGPLMAQAGSVKLTPYQALVLASMIEKETGTDAERPLVSAVFHNRIKARIRLASDPTVIYGIPNFDGNLTRAHLRAPGPYNTYVNFGLPPTPISSPGLASVRAAVSPAPSKYLYFVSKGDGTHFFSEDYATHEQAVFRYQIRTNRRRGP
jgi:UPF0755 protein